MKYPYNYEQDRYFQDVSNEELAHILECCAESFDKQTSGYFCECAIRLRKINNEDKIQPKED